MTSLSWASGGFNLPDSSVYCWVCKTMTEKICGALGCTNDAIGTVESNGRTVWTCRECANENIEVKL